LIRREELMKLQKLGGWAAIISAFAGIASFVLIQTIMYQGVDRGPGTDIDPAKMMGAYHASPMAFRVFYILGVVSVIVGLLIALALQERMQSKAPHLMRLAVIAASASSALGLTACISGFLRYTLIAGTGDASAYRSALVMFTCFTLTATNIWGWVLLLIGYSALRTRALPKILSYVILVDGIIEILQFVTFRTSLDAPMGFADFVLVPMSMVWLGVVLIRKPLPILAQT
jgi:hypothetical protein